MVLTAVVNTKRPPTVAQIGRSLGHPRQVVQRATTRLIELELITSAPNPEHKRASLLLPTSKGMSVRAEIDGDARSISADLLAQIDTEVVATAAQNLQTIRLAMETYLKERAS